MFLQFSMVFWPMFCLGLTSQGPFRDYLHVFILGLLVAANPSGILVAVVVNPQSGLDLSSFKQL